MATWSRVQSQNAGGTKAIPSGLKSHASSHLARNEKVQLANVRENKRLARWAEEAPTYKKVREYNHTIAIIPSRKRRGFSGCKMSAEIRAIVEGRKASRRAFFATIGATI